MNSEPADVSEHHCDHSHHGHSHGLTRSDELVGVSDSRLLWTVGLNQLLTVGQVIAGILSGSSALLSDAAHNFSDANTLLIAYVARRIARREASESYTFGYQRAELIGAVVNLTLLAAVGLLLVVEAVKRFFEPVEIVGWLMAAAALLALIIDVVTAWMLWSMSQGSLNVRAAFLHNVADALGSLAVLLGAGAVVYFGWWWIDAVLTLVISAYILQQAWQLFPQAVRILMEGTPVGLDLDALINDLESVDGVDDIHHVHVWQLDESRIAFEGHVVLTDSEAYNESQVKSAIKTRLRETHNITHSTLEIENVEGSCQNAGRSGCASV